MRVPTLEAVSCRGDEAAAGLDKTPGEKHALSKAVVAVGILCFFRFLAEVEGLPYAGRQQHLESLPGELVDVGMFGRLDLLAIHRVYHRHKGPPVRYALRRNRFRQAEVG